MNGADRAIVCAGLGVQCAASLFSGMWPEVNCIHANQQKPGTGTNFPCRTAKLERCKCMLWHPGCTLKAVVRLEQELDIGEENIFT